MTKNTEIFLELLRSGVWGLPIHLSKPPDDWHTIYNMSKKQSVQAVVFDGVQKLPKAFIPPKELVLEWYGITMRTEKISEAHERDLVSLIKFLSDCNIDNRLMKGQGCASFYPKPWHRQSGDIDLFVGERQYNKAQDLIRNHGVKIEKESVYDVHFTWGKTIVEMHKWETFFYYPFVNRRLQSICRKEEWNKSIVVNIGDQPIALFNATFNAFYIFVHLYHHFLQVGIGLRQICDWMLWMKHQEAHIDWERLHIYVQEIDAERPWKAFYGLTAEHLGLRLTVVPKWMQQYSQKDVDFILEDVFSVGNFGKYGDSIQKRSFGGGFLANIASFGALTKRLIRVSRFGPCEVVSYPLWRIFCDRAMFSRYLTQKSVKV